MNLQKTWLYAIACTLLLLTACRKKDFLQGYDTGALFAKPTDTEISSIIRDWQMRDLTPSSYSVVEQHSVAKGKYILKIISFRLQDIIEYGAIVTPTQAGSFPVKVHVGGFGYQLTTNSVKMVLDTSNTGSLSILAIPALRGQSLQVIINDTTYTTPLSGGRHCDAFDGATDDVLAFLNVIDSIEPKADVTRTAIRGGSRGGTVALLAGIRDTRVKRAVCIVGPADMLTLTAANQNDDTYQCQFLDDLVNKQATITATRQKMIASSPYYFADRLPLIQMHMGTKDKYVPVQQAYDLRDKLANLGQSQKLELFIYDRTHEDIATNNPDMETRIGQFLEHL
jgi:cephalosporin-C deacetylase-like acetyl esterase